MSGKNSNTKASDSDGSVSSEKSAESSTKTLSDPDPDERFWYRHVTTGDVGYLVRRGGKSMIRFDRVNEEILRPFNKNEWVEDRDFRPMTQSQVSQVCFEADKMFCRALGLADAGRREWLNLSDDKRIEWMNRGPSHDQRRHGLWSVMMTYLKAFARE
jgi:hypothetical protein